MYKDWLSTSFCFKPFILSYYLFIDYFQPNKNSCQTVSQSKINKNKNIIKKLGTVFNAGCFLRIISTILGQYYTLRLIQITCYRSELFYQTIYIQMQGIGLHWREGLETRDSSLIWVQSLEIFINIIEYASHSNYFRLIQLNI